MPMTGQKPLSRKMTTTAMRTQKTDMSKYSATPRQTPSRIPSRER